MKAEGKYILHPIGQFRQQFLRCSDTQWFAENYQVFVYPVCRYNLEDFKDEYDPGNEIKKEIMIQESVHESSTLDHFSVSHLSDISSEPACRT